MLARAEAEAVGEGCEIMDDKPGCSVDGVTPGNFVFVIDRALFFFSSTGSSNVVTARSREMAAVARGNITDDAVLIWFDSEHPGTVVSAAGGAFPVFRGAFSWSGLRGDSFFTTA